MTPDQQPQPRRLCITLTDAWTTLDHLGRSDDGGWADGPIRDRTGDAELTDVGPAEEGRGKEGCKKGGGEEKGSSGREQRIKWYFSHLPLISCFCCFYGSRFQLLSSFLLCIVEPEKTHKKAKSSRRVCTSWPANTFPLQPTTPPVCWQQPFPSSHHIEPPTSSHEKSQSDETPVRGH